MTVDEALERLNEESVQTLQLCFENGQTHFVVFDTDYYVGVYCEHLNTLAPESIEGFWSCGRIQRGESE